MATIIPFPQPKAANPVTGIKFVTVLCNCDECMAMQREEPELWLALVRAWLLDGDVNSPPPGAA